MRYVSLVYVYRPVSILCFLKTLESQDSIMFVDFPPKEFSLEIAVLHVENTCYEYLEADNSGWLVDNVAT